MYCRQKALAVRGVACDDLSALTSGAQSSEGFQRLRAAAIYLSRLKSPIESLKALANNIIIWRPRSSAEIINQTELCRRQYVRLMPRYRSRINVTVTI